MLITCLGYANVAMAINDKIGIRDTETELFLEKISAPLLQAAALEPKEVTIHLVPDNEPNAFVANGLNIFLHTGLISLLKTPEQLAGVIAHEIGHIRGGHIVRTAESARKNMAAALLSGLLIGAAGAASKNGQDSVAGALLGGMQTAQLAAAAHSRTQEAAADQAALDLLQQANITMRGLPEVMKLLSDYSGEEFTSSGFAYSRSHPSSRERVALLQNALQHDRAPQLSPQLQQQYVRVRAKLAGFLSPIDDVKRLYPANDTSFAARYAHAVLAHRQGNIQQALRILESLPTNDAYVQEMRGQFLFESGQVVPAIAAYRRAVALHPYNPLLTMQLGVVLAQQQTAATDKESFALLKKSLADDSYIMGYRTAAEVAARLGHAGEATLYSAQAALQQGDTATANDLATRAKQLLPPHSPQGYTAEDILRQTTKTLSEGERS